MANDKDEPQEIAVPPDGQVRRVGQWAVGTSRGEPFAVSRRCRHNLADLSDGRVDADGCLVCPWHAARYDVRTGKMVDGPKGVLFYRGPTPGYSGLVRAYARRLPLRIGKVVRRAGRLVVGGRQGVSDGSMPRSRLDDPSATP